MQWSKLARIPGLRAWIEEDLSPALRYHARVIVTLFAFPSAHQRITLEPNGNKVMSVCLDPLVKHV